jgi:hypothetical protein
MVQQWRGIDPKPFHHGGANMRVSPLLLAVVLAACQDKAHPSSADSAFAAMQARGQTAMGVDQYTSTHLFEDRPDGGLIVLQRDAADSADKVGIATIRAHMTDIAVRFSQGDFSLPGMVHAMTVPGTEVMTARRAHIAYIVDTLPRGGEVRIVTSDSAAIAAVHEFLAFQRSEHHAMDH